MTWLGFKAFGPTEHLTNRHTIFGEVIEGNEVLDQITRRDPNSNPGFGGDVNTLIEIDEDAYNGISEGDEIDIDVSSNEIKNITKNQGFSLFNSSCYCGALIMQHQAAKDKARSGRRPA